jgi:hypothetical protein
MNELSYQDFQYAAKHWPFRSAEDKGLIGKLLGEPDQLKCNPHYRSGPSMRMYAQDRVHKAEKRKAFVEHKAGREKRSQAALAAADKRRDTRSYKDGSSYAISSRRDA